MKRKYIAFAFIGIGFLSTTMAIHADQTTSVLSPKFKLNTWCRGRTHHLAASERGPRSTDASFTVYYDSNGIIGSLESSYKSNSNRKFEIHLKDEDPIGNENDILKKYSAKFTGRNITSISRTDNYDKLIDTENDIEAELYVTGKLGSISGDQEISGGTNLFNYQLKLR